PDVTFLAGSCNYVNEPPFDRPGKPYGLDSSIYQSMAAEKADLMLWLGDNWYTREIDYANRYGLWYRALHDRAAPILQPLLANTPNLAIWDDHDFGPNDYAFSYIHKEESRKVFNALWLNPSSGHQNQGIYTRYQLADVDFFLMDDRWWRSFDEMADSINGQPNPDKLMWGKQQLAWLKEELRISQRNRFINFRVIATGSQVLNPVSPWDRMRAFPAEYFDFINFLREEKIEGIVFLTGDRHHSEIIKVQEPGLYPLYDVTSSPLTSGTHVFDGPEKDNPYRVVGVDRFQNYARIQVTGPRNGRKLHIAFKGLKGEVLAEYAIEAAILKVPKG
ncbi:MAG TPA: alkaline phosphatase D family protein, partial [Phnomibacter sp.]|nr:alkaline phosphatase D family protein [Phnomibacter sp.]